MRLLKKPETIKLEESDEKVENDEDYENYDYDCDWVDYSDGEETF